MAEIYAYIADRKPTADSGIAVCSYDAEKGCLRHLRTELQGMGLHIGMMLLCDDMDVLYCTDETTRHPSRRSGGGGRILAFSVDRATGALALLSETASYGAKPSYIEMDETRRYLLVTNHGGRETVTCTARGENGEFTIETHSDESNVVLFPIRPDGSLDAPADIYKLSGRGPRPFQNSAHAHSIKRLMGENCYVICDKGGDGIYTMKVDYRRRKIVPCGEGIVPCAAGSAPRYSAVHPREPYVYVNKESACKLTVFRALKSGALKLAQTIDNTPAKSVEVPKDVLIQSDICISTDGQYLYDMLRIYDVIQVYRIDNKTGRLALIQTIDTPPDGRSMTISPDGRFIACTFASAGRTEVYPICGDGTLGAAVSRVYGADPSCLCFCEKCN